MVMSRLGFELDKLMKNSGHLHTIMINWGSVPMWQPHPVILSGGRVVAFTNP